MITIHTATYNRGYILGKAYESLKNQTNKNFEWIITDDGSTDNTQSLVEKWQKEENGFPIIYNKLNHVGIPGALNSGVNKANTEWFLILDSDDYLVPDAVEKVSLWIDEIKDNYELVGVGFARCFPNGEYMKNQMPKIDDNIGYVDASNIERNKYNLDMDMCEVSRVAVFKKYPFQVWPTETFAPEQLNYNEIALSGLKIRWRKEKLYICDYLEDGMTKDDKIVKKNPMGFAMMHNQNIKIYSGLKRKSFDVIQMIALCYYAKHLEYLKESNNKMLTFLLFPLGIILGIRRCIQYKKLK